MMSSKCINITISQILIVFLCLIVGSYQNEHHRSVRSPHVGLYDPTDDVIEVNSTTFHPFVYGRTYGSYVEFYNAYCGHCRKFAPKWKEFATDLIEWRDVAAIVALDCSSDINNDICRDFEIMAYPTIKYFPPNYAYSAKAFGVEIEEQEPLQLKQKLIGLLQNVTEPPKHWPNLSAVEVNDINTIFVGIPDAVQYVFLIYPEERSTVGYEVALDLHTIKQIQIRQVDSTLVAMNLELIGRPGLYVVNRNHELTSLSLINFTRELIRSTIRQFIHNRFSTIPTPNAEPKKPVAKPKPIETNTFMVTTANPLENKRIKDLLNTIQQMKGVVFQADMEHALKTTLFTEIPRFSELTGERLIALQRFITVLNKYAPVAESQRGFFQELHVYVMGSDEIKGEYFENKVKRLRTKYQPIFNINHWVGCQGSTPNLRGFTCGLWQLFHHLTVRATEIDESQDPLEVLQAIHEYVKYFFGCSQCSLHFQSMAKSNDIWGVRNKEDAVLWLWEAHNEVNTRLKGDTTEDPLFPKIQYPTSDVCPECRRKPIYNHSQDSEWDKMEVLNFMKRIYAPQNVSRYGETEVESVLPYFPAALRAQRSLRRAFSEIDLRVGILLYVFCIGMMVLAVRMFIRKRGYRKKLISYDHLNGA